VPIEQQVFPLNVRGEIPSALEGSLVVATSRRHKDQRVFSRWHDSKADLLRLDLHPGRPGRIEARFLSVDPTSPEFTHEPTQWPFYATQPNHGINIEYGTVWATNLLFGAPLEIDLHSWTPRRVLRYVEPRGLAPQLSSTSHFAWSLDRRYAYFHQSLLEREQPNALVRATDLILVRLDTRTSSESVWRVAPPPDDAGVEGANFHSAFYFEEAGRRFVGLLRTGAVLEHLAPHESADEHAVAPMSPSTIWIIEIDETRHELNATLLPGVRELGALALSHLDVDASSRNGFVLYANYKQADVAEETHGTNIYGEPADHVREHYSGMTVEPLNCGLVIRYERRDSCSSLRTFRRPYDPSRTSLGHSWLPINIELNATREHLFCSFAGFRPRLLPRHIAAAYPGIAIEPTAIRYVPPVLIRMDAETLEPDYDKSRSYISYAEPMAFTVAGSASNEFVCTFSPELGLRIYRADDLSMMVCHAISPYLISWNDTHFRPDPAHMMFARH
jgi:hypothetical protein